ncbi:hypothetical protein H9P43_002420 [Blastocladiella emersonii ATCC 22665]|nr:hypothetical protein H9P43_002420 [Blastocladiella emersonii ATCC 22665]
MEPSEPVQPPTSDAGADPRPPPAKRLKRPRVSHACETCKRRKSKCDGQLPCRNCSENHLECRYSDPTPRQAKGAARAAAASGALTAAGDPTALLDPPPPTQQPLDSNTATSSMQRAPTAQEIEEISDSMTLFVRIDDDGHPRSFSNFGPSNGMHVLRKWSASVRSGVVHHPAAFGDRIPLRELQREAALFPAKAIVRRLVDVYFETVGVWIPMVDRRAVDRELALDVPKCAFHVYAMMACGAMRLEMANRITAVNARVLLSRVFAERAKHGLLRMDSLHLQSIEGVQAALLLTYYSLNVPSMSPWIIAGTAVRIAQDVGLYLPPDTAQFRAVQRCVPTALKTFGGVFVVDCLMSLVTGRPAMLREEECYLDFEGFLRTPENQAKYADELLVDTDHPFIWVIRLASIMSKVTRSLNSIELRRKLPYTLPEIHQLLSDFRAALPASMLASRTHPTPVMRCQAAVLELHYYSLVISLYRPLVSARSSVIPAPLKQQYLALLNGALVAMLDVFDTIAPDLASYPHTVFHELLSCMSCCVLLVAHDPSAGRTLTATTLGYLDRIHGIIQQCAEVWPAIHRLALVTLEIKATVMGTTPSVSSLDAHLQWVTARINAASEATMDLLETPRDDQRAAVALVAERYLTLEIPGVPIPRAAAAVEPAAVAAAATHLPTPAPLILSPTSAALGNPHASGAALAPAPPPGPDLLLSATALANFPWTPPPPPQLVGAPPPSAMFNPLPPAPPPLQPYLALPTLPDALATTDLSGVIDWSAFDLSVMPGGISAIHAMMWGAGAGAGIGGGGGGDGGGGSAGIDGGGW